jgi:hypothetical protein
MAVSFVLVSIGMGMDRDIDLLDGVSGMPRQRRGARPIVVRAPTHRR